MFPRLPRLLRLALVVLSLIFSLFLLLMVGRDDHHPGMVRGGEDSSVFLHRFPSLGFHGPLSPVDRQPPWMTTTVRHKVTMLSRLNAATTGPTNDTGKSVLHEKDIVNPHNFKYLLNPGKTVCSSSGAKHIRLLVYVHSAPANLRKRQSIRATWGDKIMLQGYNATLVFIMGSVNEEKLSHLVAMESERYGDIVQEDFLDSYRNLTFKAVAGLKWAANYCPHADYILKSDDDILINIHKVVKHLRDVVEPQYGRSRLILCNQWLRMKIIRDKKSKWYIPEEEFPGQYFPPYCSGSAFVLSGDMAQLMYQASLVTRFFWVDDYYITGALVKHLNVQHRRLNDAYSLNPSVAEAKFQNDTGHQIFFFHMHKLRALYSLWQNMTRDDFSRAARAQHSSVTHSNSVHPTARAA